MKMLILTILFIIIAVPVLLAQAGDTLWIAPVNSPILAIKFSPDDKIVYVATYKSIEKRNSETGTLISEFQCPLITKYPTLYCFRFSTDCSKAIKTTFDSILVWDLKQEQLQWKKDRKDFDSTIRSLEVEISPDGKNAYFGAYGPATKNNLFIYNINEMKEANRLDLNGYFCRVLASPDGKYFVTFQADKNGFVNYSIWDAVKLVQTNSEFAFNIWKETFTFLSYDSKKLFNKLGATNSNGYIHDLFTHLNFTVGYTQSQTMKAACFSRGSKYFVNATTEYSNKYPYKLEGCIDIWSLETVKKIKIYKGLKVTSLEMSNDNSKLAVGALDSIDNKHMLVLLKQDFNDLSIKDKLDADSIQKPYTYKLQNNKLNISPIGLFDNFNLQISNLSGKIILTQNLNQNLDIDLSGLANGAYYCRIECAENVFTEKFTITK